MDHYRRKLWGDRATWIGVAAATAFVVFQYVGRGGDLRLYILIGWGVVVGWLVFFSELRIGRRRPQRSRGALWAGWAAFVTDERTDAHGERHRSFSGTAPGVLTLEPAGIRWRPASPDEGPEEALFDWADVYSWRLSGVLPAIARASGYLLVTLFGGRELLFHVHSVRKWRRNLREAMVIGPTYRAREPTAAAAAEPAAPPSDATEPAVEATEPAPTEAALSEDVPWVPELEPVIGVECHVELSTASKMFCGCPTAFGADPNSQICPVCTGQPGSLPVINRAAIGYALRIALALGCEITPRSFFHRKNYFYPDMPKNYQISQYDVPLATGGHLDVEVDGVVARIGIARVHVEEDTGKTVHGSEGGRIGDATHAMIDYNRAGIPLVEIVTEPDITSPELARAYVAELRMLLLSLGVSDVRMEEGSLRCDANVSVRPVGSTDLGVKTEIKNMNSLRSVQRALDHEIERQGELVGAGRPIIQETRHFDEGSGTTIGGRAKEYSSDYRYFQDPDLLPLAPEPSWISEVRSSLPELPAARRSRFVAAYGLSPADARTLTAGVGLADVFERAVSAYGGQASSIARWYLGELAQLANERGVEVQDLGVSPEHVAELQRLVDDGTVTLTLAKGEVLRRVVETGTPPAQVISEAGLAQISDSDELAGIVDEVVAAHPEIVEQIRGGKQGAVNALIGQVMKRTKGQARAEIVRELLEERVSS